MLPASLPCVVPSPDPVTATPTWRWRHLPCLRRSCASSSSHGTRCARPSSSSSSGSGLYSITASRRGPHRHLMSVLQFDLTSSARTISSPTMLRTHDSLCQTGGAGGTLTHMAGQFQFGNRRSHHIATRETDVESQIYPGQPRGIASGAQYQRLPTTRGNVLGTRAVSRLFGNGQ